MHAIPGSAPEMLRGWRVAIDGTERPRRREVHAQASPGPRRANSAPPAPRPCGTARGSHLQASDTVGQGRGSIAGALVHPGVEDRVGPRRCRATRGPSCGGVSREHDADQPRCCGATRAEAAGEVAHQRITLRGARRCSEPLQQRSVVHGSCGRNTQGDERLA